MAVILDALKKPLDDIALFVQLRIKVMLNPVIGFIGDTSNGTMLSEENANLLATVRFICKNFFTREFYAFDKSTDRFGVMNVPAGQYHIQKLHSLVDEDVNFGILKPNGHSYALCKKWSQS